MKLKVLLLCSIIFLVIPIRILAITSTEIYQQIDSDIATINNLSDKIYLTNNQEEVSTIFLQEIPTTRTHYEESSRYYLSLISSETNPTLITTLNNINTSINGLSESLSRIEQAINSSDLNGYTNALNDYDSYIMLFNTAVEELDIYYGATDYSWLAIPFWISLLLSGYLFLISRGSPILPSEQVRNQFEFALFKSSLWPLAGSTISYFWYLLTPPGGTFYILYWLIFIGFIQFIRALYLYLRYSKPAINQAKQEEKQKLQSLLDTESFQKANLKEKAKAIEGLKPILSVDQNTIQNTTNLLQKEGGSLTKERKIPKWLTYTVIFIAAVMFLLIWLL